jgi:chemotaxis protein CheD
MDAGYVEHLAGNRYFDPTFSAEAVKVLPGEYFVTTTDMLLVTVLGSCVSACIRDKAKGIGGMNHFMLADSGEARDLSSSARYGTYAMEILINHLLKLGARRSNLEAKVFGGGRVMSALASSRTSVSAIAASCSSSCAPKASRFQPGTCSTFIPAKYISSRRPAACWSKS